MWQGFLTIYLPIFLKRLMRSFVIILLTTSVTTTFYLEGRAFIKARCLFEQLLGGYGKFFWSFIILYLHRAKMLARMVCGKEVPNGANIKEGLGWGGQNLFD